MSARGQAHHGRRHLGGQFFDTLVSYAVTVPDEEAIAFLSTESGERRYTWRDLLSMILGTRDALRAEGLRPGGAVAIITESVEEQVIDFLAAAAAGLRPSIFSYPSPKQSVERFEQSFLPMLEAGSFEALICAPNFAPAMGRGRASRRVVSIQCEARRPRDRDIAELRDARLDFCQYSSGTTGLRKGVLITEAMFLAQALSYGKSLMLERTDAVASWLPLYHDMGLLSAFLIPMYHGVRSYHMSPFHWLQEPALLFETATRERSTVMGLPNFAYLFMADRVPDEALARVDLSNVRAFVSAGETVRREAFERFYERFERVGVRREQLQASYAAAENVYAITQTPLGEPPKYENIDAATFRSRHVAVPGDGLHFTSCGPPIEGTEIRIEGAKTDGEVGEIQIRSDCLFEGYLGSREEVVHDGWYSSGDLGYLRDGNVFVTGRNKDMIVHRGQNIYPTDIETALAGVPAIKKGRVVAFGVADEATSTENIVVAVESDRTMRVADLKRVIRQTVEDSTDIALSDVFVVSPNTLRKSTSGKLSRGKNRELYLAAREEDDLAEVTPPVNDMERRVERILDDVLKTGARIDRTLHISSDLGADSVTLPRIAQMVSEEFGVRFDANLLLQLGTIAAIAEGVMLQEMRDDNIVCINSGGDAQTCFIIHGGDVRATDYLRLTEHLEEHPTYVLQDPHWRTGMGAFESIEAMASNYLAAILQVQEDGDYVLLGDCFGGFVAFEMAKTLLARRQTESVRLVFIETFGPHNWVERVRHGFFTRRVIPYRPVQRLFGRRIDARLRNSNPIERIAVIGLLDPRDRDRNHWVRRAFPGLFEEIDLQKMEASNAWDLVLSTVATRFGLRFQAATLTGLIARNSLINFYTTLDHIWSYRPKHLPISLTAISGFEATGKYGAWRKHVKEFHHHQVDLQPTLRCPDPHNAFLEEVNLKKYLTVLSDAIAT